MCSLALQLHIVLPARGADRGHVDVTVVPLAGQIRYLFIETCVLALSCSGDKTRHEGQSGRIQHALASG
jgi:hypothetical protein